MVQVIIIISIPGPDGMGQRHPEVLRQQPGCQPQGRRPHAPLRVPQRPAQEWTLSSGSVTAWALLW